MKDMKTKVIALMLVIPLMLIFSTSTVIKSTEILVNVPVSSVEIEGDETRYIDLAEEEKLKLNVNVYPENASNKKVTFTTEEVAGQNTARVKIDDNGLITPLSTGSISVIANADGGRMDRVQVVITSSKPLLGEITETEDLLTLDEGDSLFLSSKITKPDNVGSVQYSYLSSDKEVATISKLGKIQALRQGVTTLTAVYEGITVDENGRVTEGTQTLSYLLTVNMTDEYLSFGQGNKMSDCPVVGNETELSFDVNIQKLKSNQIRLNLFSDFEKAEEGELYLDYDKNLLEITEKSVDLSKGRVDLKVKAKKEVSTLGEEVKIILKKGNEAVTVGTARITVGSQSDAPVPFARFNLDEVSGVALLGKSTTTQVAYAELDVGNADENTFYVVYSSTDQKVITVTSNQTVCYITAKSVGKAYIKTAVYDAVTGEELFSSNFAKDNSRYIPPLEVEVLNPFKQLSVERAKSGLATYKDALDSVFAVGYYDFTNGNGLGNLTKKEFSATLVSGVKNNGSRAETSTESVAWTSDNPQIAVVENGKLTLNGGEGVVTLTVKNDDLTLEKLTKLDNSFQSASASVTVNVRSRGVNVVNDEQLYCLTKDGNYEVVLQSPVSLGDELKTVQNYDTFNYNKYVNTYTYPTDCTADNTYYRNINRVEQSKIRCAIELTNNLYGNGYSIDADCLTMLYYQKSGSRIFKGPINLVSYSVSASEGNMAVKSQDSVIFMVKKEGITVTNCELKGCLNSSILSGDSADLNNLNYCGTVLEAVGDNFSLTYSRVNLGRTAVRVFGKPNTQEAITASTSENFRTRVNISNCILSGAREFILKIGTNQIKRKPSVSGKNYLNSLSWQNIEPAFWENASPYLTDEKGNKLEPDGDNLNDYFYDNYVLTDVTVQDSAFYSAGLFSVGLDSIFGGLVLNGWDYNETYRFSDWRDVGGTSYPAVLRLKGDVRFYDWKDVETINSDTLLEGHDTSVGQIIGFNMDFGELVKNYKPQEGKAGIVSYYNAKPYANGAIAYFGGGKNYSMVDLSGVGANFNQLSKFSIPIELLSGNRVQFLYYTAGKYPFRFQLYDTNSKLSVEKQIQDINENTAFSWIKK